MAWVSILNEDDWTPHYSQATCVGCQSTYADGTSDVGNSYSWSGSYWEPPDYATATSVPCVGCDYCNPSVPCIRYTGDTADIQGLRVTLELLEDYTAPSGFFNVGAAMANDPISPSGIINDNIFFFNQPFSTGSPYLTGHQFIVTTEDAAVDVIAALERITGAITFASFDNCGPDVRKLLRIVDVEADIVPTGNFWTNFINSREE